MDAVQSQSIPFVKTIRIRDNDVPESLYFRGSKIPYSDRTIPQLIESGVYNKISSITTGRTLGVFTVDARHCSGTELEKIIKDLGYKYQIRTYIGAHAERRGVTISHMEVHCLYWRPTAGS